MFSRRLIYPIFLSALVSPPITIDAQADFLPGRNAIRIVSPTGPGAPPDVLGRLIATETAEAEGWRIVVENKPGALQTIAMT